MCTRLWKERRSDIGKFSIALAVATVYNPAYMDFRLKRFLIKLVVTCASMLIVVKILPWATVTDPVALLVAALLLGILNSVLRPLLILLTLPINILSFGLFIFVINGLILYLISWLVPGFELKNFGSAVLASILISIVSSLINHLIRDTGHR